LAGRESTTEFRVLGPFEVCERGHLLDVGIGKQRALLAFLLMNAPEVVSTDRIIDALWDDRPPASALNSVRVYVSHVRKALGNGRLLTRGRGYLLSVEPDELDLTRFELLLRRGRAARGAGDAEGAADILRAALGLWRGPPLADLADEPFAQNEIARLEELRIDALEERIEADLALGRHAELVSELDALVRAHPLRERLLAQLMLALYRAGRQTEALEAYRQARTTLVEELGIEPGRRLQELERAILRQDSELDLPAPASAARDQTRHRSGLVIAAGATILLAAAIAVPLVAFIGGSSPGLASVAGNSVGLIVAETNRLVADVPVGNGPTSVAAGEDAVWVTSSQDNSVTRIDPHTSSVVGRIEVGSAPSGIAVGSNAVWVANTLDGTVSRIDPQTNTVVQRIAVGITPIAVAVGEHALWVTAADERSVTKIDAISGHVLDRIEADAAGRGIAVGGGGVWITDESSRSVVRIDPRSGSVMERVGVGNGPTGITFGLGAVWVVNSLDGTIMRIDPATNAVTATIPVGGDPDRIAVGPGAVWVSSEFTGAIARVDPVEKRVVERIPVVNRPKGLAVANGRVWFAVQPSGVGHRGGRLVIARTVLLTSIDPTLSPHPVLVGTVYEGLLGVAWRGGSEGTQIVPGLAAALPAATAGRTSYTFQLRSGIRYSDGRFVRASDFRRAFERLFRTRALLAVPFGSLVGADACERQPRRCDLSRGVQTDDANGRIVFHLRQPDAEFLYNVTGLPSPIPPGTPDRDVGIRPVPSTGPYRIESFVPRRVLTLVRNPQFHVRSRTARPNGFPDEIEVRLRGSRPAAVTAVERGQADVSMGIPGDRLEEVQTRYASQLHLNPEPATMFFVFLNTRLPPFDDVRVRRAFNYAVDRAAVARSVGGPELAKPFCQLRPPSVAVFSPYCPYTADPGRTGEWKAPDLPRARRLVAASGTRGMKVTLWAWHGNIDPAARVAASALERLGYRTRLRWVDTIDDYFPKVLDAKTRAQAGLFGWIGAAGSPPSYVLKSSLTCGAIRPLRQNNNPSFFCNRRIDALIARALKIQAVDPAAAALRWQRIERELVDLAPWVPLFTPQRADFVSKRVGNFQYNPAVGLLLDQLWVR
jgi:YVTN family beta-propeller protein